MKSAVVLIGAIGAAVCFAIFIGQWAREIHDKNEVHKIRRGAASVCEKIRDNCIVGQPAFCEVARKVCVK